MLTEHKKILIFILLFMSATLLAASLYIRDQRADYVLSTKLKIAEQETTLAAIAELTDRDGADAVVSKIIQDCSSANRERFDNLLSSLAQLSNNELQEIEQLFNACGNFYAERKAVMVARFEREYEVYKDFIEILSLVDPKAENITYDTDGWGALVAMEKKRSELSTKLVEIQGDIITSLLQNIQITSDSMQLLVVEGQQVRESLNQLSAQIDQQRETILAL